MSQASAIECAIGELVTAWMNDPASLRTSSHLLMQPEGVEPEDWRTVLAAFRRVRPSHEAEYSVAALLLRLDGPDAGGRPGHTSQLLADTSRAREAERLIAQCKGHVHMQDLLELALLPPGPDLEARRLAVMREITRLRGSC